MANARRAGRRAGRRADDGVGALRGEQTERNEEPETTGEHEEPETGGLLRRLPDTMLTVPIALLAGSLAVGVFPSVAEAVGRAVDEMLGSASSPPPEWTPPGVLLDLLSSALAVALAAWAVAHPVSSRLHTWTTPLRRLHSGHIGDYVAWLVVGTVVVAVLALPG
ncbi:hypothetical protein [Streptomyces sp. NPDC005004]